MKKVLLLIVVFIKFTFSFGQTTSEEYYKSAKSKWKLKDFKGAISDYDKIIEINPKDTNAYYIRALTKQAIEDYVGELDDCNKLVELNPYRALYYYNRGNSKEFLKDYQGAISDQTKAIELDSTFYFPYQSRGNAKLKLKDTVGALEDFSEVIKRVIRGDNDSTNLSRCYSGRGIIKDETNDFNGAILDLDKAIALRPFPSHYYFRGLSKYHLKDIDGACLDWNKAIELATGETYKIGEAKKMIKEHCK